MLDGKRVEVKIDYINCTYKGKRATLLGETDGTWSKGLYAYHSQLKTSVATYQYGDNRQGHMVTLAGQSLDDLRRGLDCNEYELLKLFDGLKCTRIDLALDAYGFGLSSKELERMWLGGEIKPRAKTGTMIADSLGVRGDTFYLGSLENRSGKLFRGYEKGKKEGNQLDRFRMELQLGSEGGANDCLVALQSKESQEAIEDTIKYAISGYINNRKKDNVLTDILSSEVVKFKVSNKHKSNRRKWLEGQVLPVLKEEMDKDEDFAIAVANFLNAR